MDVNYILAREQIELALARGSLHAGARAAHQGLADQYRAQVDDYRDSAVDAAVARKAAPAR
jgi:hypothetical protein